MIALAGVPQVIVSHLTEQFYWGSRVAELGVGPRPIMRDALSSKRLVARLRQVLDDPRVGERAGALRRELARRDPLEEAVRELCGPQAGVRPRELHGAPEFSQLARV
jgi:UDP:flavonoid glycosyltransferase YjiC (YdhE family)